MEQDTTIEKTHVAIINRARNFFLGSKKRALFTTIGVLVLLFIVGRISSAQNKTPQYQTAQVTKGSIIASVTESGNVASSSNAAVGSPTKGVLTQLFVKNGDQVTQGQNLFSVKSTATAEEIASAYATFLGAQSAMQADQAKLYSLQSTMFTDWKTFTDLATNSTYQNADGSPNTTNRTLVPFNTAQDDWLAAEANYKNQQGVIAKDQASLDAASLSYQATQDSIVTAPISGTVANVSFQVGDEVNASSGNLSSELTSSATSTTNPILTIGNFSTPYVKVQASEVDVPAIRPEQKAIITLSAYPGKTFAGTVNQVDSVGTVTSGVVTYNVFINFIAPPNNILPGMSATVTIETDRRDDALTVPSSAVQNNNGETTVRVLQNGKITVIPVMTGITSNTDTEITSGLSEGQTVVTGIIQTGSTSSSSTSPFSGLGGGRGFGGGGGAAVFRGRGG